MTNKKKPFINFSFIFELICFISTLYLAIGVALNLIAKFQSVKADSAGFTFTEWHFLFLFVLATLILYLLLKYIKNPWLMRILFYLAIIQGLLFLNQAYFPYPGFIYVTIFLLFGWMFYRNLFMHNLMIVLASSAIAAFFGLNFEPNILLIILIILAAYDFWAVYQTKHMVDLFTNMAEMKVHFALIIPQNIKGLYLKTNQVMPSSELMFLGTGDLVIPAIFVVSCLKINLATSFYVALGAIVGFLGLYYIFTKQKVHQPMPGLPPLVAGCLLGYLLALLIL